MNITSHRLHNQYISRPWTGDMVELVEHMGAIQAQDYAGCKWAIGLRMNGITEQNVEQAINDGTLVRTHVLRPTWHLVSPKDIRWMLAMTAPRVNAFNSSQYRKLGLDDAIFQQSNKIIVKSLTAEKYLTRAAIEIALQQKGIATNDIRLTCIMMYAELTGLICNGPRQGKLATYTLLDDRIPPTPPLPYDEGLAALTKRYLNSHGPATVHDFAWWSGLTVADAKKGIESVKEYFEHIIVNEVTYWLPGNSSHTSAATKDAAHLLPAFDEYTVAYRDRTTLLSAAHKGKTPLEILNPVVVIDGHVAGTWRRTIKKETVEIELKPFTKFNGSELKSINKTAKNYGAFLAADVKIMP